MTITIKQLVPGSNIVVITFSDDETFTQEVAITDDVAQEFAASLMDVATGRQTFIKVEE